MSTLLDEEIIETPVRPRAVTPRPGLRRIAYGGMWILIASIPLETTVLISGIGTLSRAIGLAVLVPAAAALLGRGTTRRLIGAHGLMLAFTAWVAGSYFWSLSPDRTLTQSVTMVQLAALVFLVWQFGRTRSEFMGLAGAFVFGAYAAAIGTIVRFVVLGERALRYSLGETINPNNLAFLLALAIPLAWHLGANVPNMAVRVLSRLYVPVAVFAVILTGSRGGLIATAIALIVVPWTMGHVSPLTRFAVAAALAVGVPLIAPLLPERPLERLGTTAAELSQGDIALRRHLWAASVDIWVEHPVLGVGAAASRPEIARISSYDFGAHNTYLSVAAELGTIGLAIFMMLLVAVARRVMALRGAELKTAVVLYGTLVVGLLPRHWEYRKGTWVIIAFLVGHSALSDRAGRPEPT